MYNILHIPSTLGVITKCWKDAETELSKVIEEKYHDLDEEFITKLFYCELNFMLKEASRNKQIEHAFLVDLQRKFPQVKYSYLATISAGFIADMSLHKRGEEKVTGGDFGLTITRPQVTYSSELELIIGEYRRGLLCQAKIKRRNGKWGRLSKKQREIFPERMNYLGLVLYSYSDMERHHLNPFGWQLCKGATVEAVRQWLKTDSFPSFGEATDVIKSIENASEGTDNPETIDKVIRPKNKPHLDIRVFRPGKYPPWRLRVNVEQKLAQEIKVLN